MKKFKLHWPDGKTEIVMGKKIDDACQRAGIGKEAIKTLDFYEEEIRLSAIAHEKLNITTQRASHYLDGLADLPNLGEGLEIMRTASIRNWTMFQKGADEFVRRVQRFRAWNKGGL